MWSEDVWRWLKTAPLPVVLSLSVAAAAGAIVYARNSEETVTHEINQVEGQVLEQAQKCMTIQARVEFTETSLKRMEDKMDKLIDSVALLRAEMRLDRRRVQ